MDRKLYWNKSYVDYWKEVTKEGNDNDGEYSHVKKSSNEKDYKTFGDKNAERFFSIVPIKQTDLLLDYGCGFGRFYEYFSNKCNYKGIDISEAMIKSFKDNYPKAENDLFVAEGEELPFENETFDVVICFGVFDACYQEDALKEILRVSKEGARILITGKNINYNIDDEPAIIAEEAARAKQHPNYFTDLNSLMNQIGGFADILRVQYYLRRGDFGKEKYVEEKPDTFYEWAILLERKGSLMPEFKKFSYEYSSTWNKIRKN